MVNISAMLLAMGVPVAKTTPPPPFFGLDMPHFQKHIEGAFAGRLRQSGDARHLGNVEKIFEIMRLVHETAGPRRVLQTSACCPFCGSAASASSLASSRFLAFSSSFTKRRLSVSACSRLIVFQFVQLLLEKTHLGFLRQRDASQSRNG